MSMILVSRCWGLHLDKTTQLILMALCDSADDDGSNCFPSPGRIGWKTGASKSTVYRVMEDLEGREIIRKVGMRGDYPEYQILLENAPAKAPFDKPRMGRPRKAAPGPTEKSSHHGKTFPPRENIPTMGKVVPPWEKSSHHGKSRPTMGMTSSIPVATQARPHQAPRNASVCSTQSLPSPYPVKDPWRASSIQKEKEPEPEIASTDWPPAEAPEKDWPPSPALPSTEEDDWPPPEANRWPAMWKWARTRFGRAVLCELGYRAETHRNSEILMAYTQWYRRRDLLARASG